MSERNKTFLEDVIVALVGNPNVGKSTLFNALTGGKQHTGNWAGKTVEIAQGQYAYKGKNYHLIDLPGTYSLCSQSEEEQVTADYILSGKADCILVIADATCLERNLTLALQVMNLTERTLLCMNLMDEAEKKGLTFDLKRMQQMLEIPVVGISAGKEEGIDTLKEAVRNMSAGYFPQREVKPQEDGLTEASVLAYTERAEEIANNCVFGRKRPTVQWFDKFALGRCTGKLMMLTMLFVVFWLTIVGANYPSAFLQKMFDAIGHAIRMLFAFMPAWMSSLLLDGIYTTTARVISVMLPPMLIFFPIFSLLEDLGYLPRAAFLMDNSFEKCGSCGKQVLTMALGFGCNAAGVMGCRIIASPKERLIAIITNALVPCNGRFPALIALSFFLFSNKPFVAAIFLTLVVVTAVGITLLTSKVLSRTLLRGEESRFIMEMPPYRKPKIKRVILNAVKDKTMSVLLRAIMVAAPSGALIWVLTRLEIGDRAFLTVLAETLEPIGMFLGMNGTILLAFLLSFPANELLLPMTTMIFDGTTLSTLESASVSGMMQTGMWSWPMALCTIIFILFHWPCSTTCLTIYKETKSVRWTVAAVILPTLIGLCICALLNICIR